jgi:hypothetical protein
MDEQDYTPADSAAIFRLMYDDLQIAIDGLPSTRENTSGRGRVTKATARHLKALVAAWAKDWQTVANEVEAIDQEGIYTLAPDVKNIFNRPDLRNVSETLFVLVFAMKRRRRGDRLGTQYINTIAEQPYTSKLVNGYL